MSARDGAAHADRLTVAVLGTGIMGAPIAANLAAAGYSVRAWNRTRSKAEALAGAGVEVADTPAEAVRGTDAAVTMLADGDAVASAMEGPDGGLAGLAPDAIWVQASTVGIAGIERCQALADEHSATLVDAPVLGTKQPAEQGALIVLASGPGAARERCAPLFGAIGSKTLDLGDEPGAGTRLKLVVNSWLVALTEAVAETIALAEGIDVDPRRFLETISGGPLDLPYAQLKGGAMIERGFEPSFPLDLALKDAELVREAAERHDLALPLIDAVAAQMRRASDAGHGREDMAATYFASAPRRAG